MKEKILDVIFAPEPETVNREIYDDDSCEVKKDKKKFPYELKNIVFVTVITNKRTFSFNIHNGYTWNGADIIVFLWRIVGSRFNPEFRRASMVHDYMLEFKSYIFQQVLENKLKVKEYRRLTSLIFRHIIKNQGTGTIKANIMSWCVDVFQMTQRKEWNKCKTSS